MISALERCAGWRSAVSLSRPRVGTNGLRRCGGEIMPEKGTAGVRVVGRESPGNAIAARSLGSASLVEKHVDSKV